MKQELNTRKGKSREVSSRFLPPCSSSSPNRRNSTSNSSAKRDDQNNHVQKVKHERMSGSTRVGSVFSNKSKPSGQELDIKENRRPSPWIDDEDNVMLPGRFSVDGCALYRSSSLLYESDSELSDVSFASTRSTSRSFRNHGPGIMVSSKYLHDSRARPSKGSSQGNNNMTKLRSQEDSQKANSFRGFENMMKRTNPMARYGSSMSQWALSPGRSLETQAVAFPSSNLKPPRSKGVGKLFHLGFDLFRSKKKSSPSKANTYDAEAAHQLKLMNNRLVQWMFANARACTANNKVASREKKQLVCASDALTKLRQLVMQERIKLQKKKLEMKLDHVLLSQVEYLEAWDGMDRQHLSSLSMTRKALHSALSRLPLSDGATVKIESAVTAFRKAETVTDALISTVNSFIPRMEGYVPLASQVAEVVVQEKLMLEQCDDLLRKISELEMQERSLRCCILIHDKQKLVQD